MPYFHPGENQEACISDSPEGQPMAWYSTVKWALSCEKILERELDKIFSGGIHRWRKGSDGDSWECYSQLSTEGRKVKARVCFQQEGTTSLRSLLCSQRALRTLEPITHHKKSQVRSRTSHRLQLASSSPFWPWQSVPVKAIVQYPKLWAWRKKPVQPDWAVLWP